MKHLHYPGKSFSKAYPKYFFMLAGIFCSFYGHAQELKTDGLVHTSSTKIVTLADEDFKQTTTYSKQQAKHPKTFDEIAKKDIKYPDGTVLHLKLVKNPSFGGEGSSINASTQKGSDKKETKNENGVQWDCSSSMVTLTANSTNFLNADYATEAAYIYPGAIYTFNNFYNGSYKEQTGKRYPMVYVIENPNIHGCAYINVDNPGIATSTEAVDKLTNELKGPAANGDFTYQVYETDNSAAQSLQVSGGGSYDGFSASDSYKSSGQSNSVSLTIDATKILYTINTVPQDSGFFANQKIENTPNLMVISNVKYGIRLLANLTYSFSSSKEADDFKAAYSGMGAKVNFNLNQLSQSSATSSTINCYVVGGPGNTTLSFDKKDLENQLKNIFKGATYQNAKPIGYSFNDMSGDLVGSNSATDAFPERTCVPNDNSSKLQSAYITYTTAQIPGDNKDNDTHYNVFLYPGKWGTNNGYNGYNNNPPQTQNNGEAFIAAYKTGPLNIAFPEGSSHTDPLTPNSYINVLPGNKAGNTITQDYFINNNGGLVHFHIYPNGHDTWVISEVKLVLNFSGGISQTITWGSGGASALTLTQNSTEGTLIFGPDFKPR